MTGRVRLNAHLPFQGGRCSGTDKIDFEDDD
jgi:hypothetical protein